MVDDGAEGAVDEVLPPEAGVAGAVLPVTPDAAEVAVEVPVVLAEAAPDVEELLPSALNNPWTAVAALFW